MGLAEDPILCGSLADPIDLGEVDAESPGVTSAPVVWSGGLLLLQDLGVEKIGGFVLTW